MSTFISDVCGGNSEGSGDRPLDRHVPGIEILIPERIRPRGRGDSCRQGRYPLDGMVGKTKGAGPVARLNTDAAVTEIRIDLLIGKSRNVLRG